MAPMTIDVMGWEKVDKDNLDRFLQDVTDSARRHIGSTQPTLDPGLGERPDTPLYPCKGDRREPAKKRRKSSYLEEGNPKRYRLEVQLKQDGAEAEGASSLPSPPESVAATPIHGCLILRPMEEEDMDNKGAKGEEEGGPGEGSPWYIYDNGRGPCDSHEVEAREAYVRRLGESMLGTQARKQFVELVNATRAVAPDRLPVASDTATGYNAATDRVVGCLHMIVKGLARRGSWAILDETRGAAPRAGAGGA